MTTGRPKKVLLTLENAVLSEYRRRMTKGGPVTNIICTAILTPEAARIVGLEHLLFERHTVGKRGQPRKAGHPATVVAPRAGFTDIRLDYEIGLADFTLTPGKGLSQHAMSLRIAKVHSMVASRKAKEQVVGIKMSFERRGMVREVDNYFEKVAGATGTLTIDAEEKQMGIHEQKQKAKRPSKQLKLVEITKPVKVAALDGTIPPGPDTLVFEGKRGSACCRVDIASVPETEGPTWLVGWSYKMGAGGKISDQQPMKVADKTTFETAQRATQVGLEAVKAAMAMGFMADKDAKNRDRVIALLDQAIEVNSAQLDEQPKQGNGHGEKHVPIRYSEPQPRREPRWHEASQVTPRKADRPAVEGHLHPRQRAPDDEAELRRVGP